MAKMTKSQLKTAVIYARYSSDAQTEQSIEGQLRVCQEYASKNDIIILDTYIDRAMTGTNDMRPDFQRMIKDSSQRKWNYVLVYKLDRFSRNKYETITHKHTLNINGVKVMSATENIPETPEGIILESMLEGMNQYYSAELSQKVKRGMRETRIKGNFQGGNILYGYKVEGRKIVIDEDSSEVVKYIFEEFAKGRAVYDIRNTLNSRGITYKGKELAKNTVYGILRNEKYSGKYTVNGEIIDNMYPAIISERTFNQARAIIDANKFGKSSIKVVYLLKNKMRCGYCGEKIVSDGGKSHGGKKYYYYKCKGKKANHNECKLTIFKKETLEELIIDNIIKELSKPETMDFITKKLLDIQEKEIRTNSTLSLLLKEQKQVQSSLDNLVLAVERGIMSNSTNKRLHELEKHLEELERQILIENSKEEIKVGEKEIRAFYQKALSLEPALLINCLIREIVVYDESIQIYYKTPLTISPDESRGFSFSQKIVNLKTYTQTNEKNHTNIQLTMTI